MYRHGFMLQFVFHVPILAVKTIFEQDRKFSNISCQTDRALMHKPFINQNNSVEWIDIYVKQSNVFQIDKDAPLRVKRYTHLVEVEVFLSRSRPSLVSWLFRVQNFSAILRIAFCWNVPSATSFEKNIRWIWTFMKSPFLVDK